MKAMKYFYKYENFKFGIPFCRTPGRGFQKFQALKLHYFY